MVCNPSTALVLYRAAQQHFSIGFDGIINNIAANPSVGRLFTASAAIARSPRSVSCAAPIAPGNWPHATRACPVVSTDSPDWVQQIHNIADGGRSGVRRHHVLVHLQRSARPLQIDTTIGLGLLFDTLIVRSFMTPSRRGGSRWLFWWPQNVRPQPARRMLRPHGTHTAVRDLLERSPSRRRRPIDHRPEEVLGLTSGRWSVTTGAGGDVVIQLPTGASTASSCAGAGSAAGWPAPTSPAVCCRMAAGTPPFNWPTAKSAAWSAIPLFL